MKIVLSLLIPMLLVSFCAYGAEIPQEYSLSYRVVDTGVATFYDNTSAISSPESNEEFFGQDAQYQINSPSYTDNGDGTITDNVTGLMWQKVMGEKLSYNSVFKKAKSIELAGYNDWRVPSIKELYSLIQFTGKVSAQKAIDPFIDTKYFNQPLGNMSLGEREIDAQTWSATEYVGRTMKNDETVFGVNFVDGRIKGYPKYNPRTHEPNKMYFRFVRGNKDLFAIKSEIDALYENYTDENAEKIGELQITFEEMNGWNADSDAAALPAALAYVKEWVAG